MRNIQLLPSNANAAEVKAYFRAAIEWLPSNDLINVLAPCADVAVGTTVGSTRLCNQDRAAVIRTRQETQNNPWFLLAVCDGMGGMQDGENAAIDALTTFLATALSSRLGPTRENLSLSIDAANRSLFAELKSQGGATLSACFWDHQRLLVANVGDSRVWIRRAGKNLEQITQDDNLAEQLKKQGIAVSGDVRNELLQFIGMGEEIQPHILELEATAGDMVMVTSDGIHRIHNETLNRIVSSADSPAMLVERLLALSIWNGGEDNASVVACRLPKVSSIVSGNADLWTPCSTHRLIRATSQPRQDSAFRNQSDQLDSGRQTNQTGRTAASKKSPRSARIRRNEDEIASPKADKGQVEIQISPDVEQDRNS